MNYLAFDVSKRVHECILLSEEDKILWRMSVPANRAGFEALGKQLSEVDPSTVVAGMESSGPYWQTLHLWLLRWKPAKLMVLNPLQTRAFRNANLRGSKTDRLDTLSIARLLRWSHLTLSSAHLPVERIAAARQVSRVRTELIEQRSREVVRLKAILAMVFPEFEEVLEVTTRSARAVLSRWPTPEVLLREASPEEITALLRGVSRGRFGAKKAEALLQAARDTTGVPDPHDGSAAVIGSLLHLMQPLDAEIEALGKKLEALQADQAETAALLKSIPGFGDSTVETWLAETPPIEQFKGKDGAERMVAAFGIDAKLRQSGRYSGHVKMSKRGNRYLRRAIILAARTAARQDPQCRAILMRQQLRGKHYNVAVSHVARKLIHIAFSVLTNRTAYELPAEYRLGIIQEPALAAAGA
jgi:transposase